jgi:hypothetical protein
MVLIACFHPLLQQEVAEEEKELQTRPLLLLEMEAQAVDLVHVHHQVLVLV